MIKKLRLLLLMLGIYGTHGFMPCHGTLTAEKLLNLMQRPGTTKETILEKIKTISKGSKEASKILKFNKIEMLGWIPLDLPKILARLQKDNASNKYLSLDDLLEISKSLWNLDPVYASSVMIDSSPCDEPLIHSLISEYFKTPLNNPQSRSFFKKFIDFIIAEHPTALSMKDTQNNTALHKLQCYARILDVLHHAATEPGEHQNDAAKLFKEVTELIQGFLQAEISVNAQNKYGQTALHEAQRYSALLSAKMLLDKEADPFIKHSNERDVIQEILYEEGVLPSLRPEANKELLAMLLKDNRVTADYLNSLRTENNQSIVHIAAKVGSQECINLLKAKGINTQDPILNAPDTTGKTPRNYAQSLPDEATRNTLTSLLPLQQPSTSLPHGKSTITTATTSQQHSSPARISQQQPTSQQDSSTQATPTSYGPWVIGSAVLISVLGIVGWLAKKSPHNSAQNDKDQRQTEP